MAIDINQALAVAEPFIDRHLRQFFRDLPDADADDARQNVYLRLLEKIIPAFDPARGQLAAYLNVSIKNAMLDELRKLNAGPSNCELNEADTAIETSDPHDEQLSSAILDDPERYFGERMGQFITESMQSPDRGTAAAKLGIKRESAWQNASRAKRKIRQLFESRSRFEPPVRKAS